MAHRRSQGGFSLVELIVAMVITLIVSGAIYGLMVSGQGAFRREPALIDRQQSIRIAMDLITRDIQNAGAGMSPFAQAFTDDIPANSMNNPAAPGSVVSEIFPGQRADYIEMMVNDGSCPSIVACGTPGANIFTAEPLPACIFGTPALSSFVYVSGSGGVAAGADARHPGMLFGFVPGPGGGGGCGAGQIVTQQGQAPAYNPGGNAACGPGGTNNASTPLCQTVSRIAFARYELAPENPALAVNPLNNPPSLWRSALGRNNHDGTQNAGPWVGNDGAGNPSPWQLLARGIDDMQIQYFRNGAWNNTAGTVVNLNRATILEQVRVTLSARAIGFNLGGETTYVAGAGTPGRRGQLTMQVAPRAALLGRSTALAGPNNPVLWR
jgi:prepilin-type N-terminal cleavage/methylation domain-containing protein